MSEAFNTGTEYFLSNREVEDNPFSMDTSEFEDFIDGYLFEQDIATNGAWK